MAPRRQVQSLATEMGFACSLTQSLAAVMHQHIDRRHLPAAPQHGTAARLATFEEAVQASGSSSLNDDPTHPHLTHRLKRSCRRVAVPP